MGRPIRELKLPGNLPEWFRIMPDDAMLGYKEISSLLLCDAVNSAKMEASG